MKRKPNAPPIIMLTAWGTIESAVAAMRLGAKDYLTKPWDNARLLATIATHLRLSASQRQTHSAFGTLLGDSPSFKAALEDAARVAATSATVLLTGESGTGKSMLARALHAASARSEGPLVEVHVGALAESLFERELFGHVRGAFTDAREAAPGRVSAARVIAATNADLRAEVAAGRFRQDLFFRLAVFPLRVPSLRERAPDVPARARARHRASSDSSRQRRHRVRGLGARTRTRVAA